MTVSSTARLVASSPTRDVSIATRINTRGWTDSPYISQDGRRLYFMYTRTNLMPLFLGGAAERSGPFRPGSFPNPNPFEESDICCAYLDANGKVERIEVLPFNDGVADSMPCEIIVGGTTYLYYTTTDGGATNRIVYRTKPAGGSWSAEVDVGAGINSANAENPHVSASNTLMVFTSDRAGGAGGGRDLWISSFSLGSWGAATSLNATINTAGTEDQFWADAAFAEYWFTRNNQIYKCDPDGGGGFINVTNVNFGGATEAEPSMPDDKLTIYFASASATTRRLTIMKATRATTGSAWGTARPVD